MFGFFYVGEHSSVSTPSITYTQILIITLLIPLSLIFVIGIQYFNKHSGKIWKYPSWSLNPFNFTQPLQFFHFATFMLIPFGLSSSFSLLWNGFDYASEAILPLTLGCGLLIGLHLCLYVFQNKIEGDKSFKELYKIF